jgi:hypothetical protein
LFESVQFLFKNCILGLKLHKNDERPISKSVSLLQKTFLK